MEKQIQIPGQAEIAAHLSGMIPFDTIAYRDQSKTKGEPFFALHAYLEKTYPLVHENMEKQVSKSFSNLTCYLSRYRIHGSLAGTGSNQEIRNDILLYPFNTSERRQKTGCERILLRYRNNESHM